MYVICNRYCFENARWPPVPSPPSRSEPNGRFNRNSLRWKGWECEAILLPPRTNPVHTIETISFNRLSLLLAAGVGFEFRAETLVAHVPPQNAGFCGKDIFLHPLGTWQTSGVVVVWRNKDPGRTRVLNRRALQNGISLSRFYFQPPLPCHPSSFATSRCLTLCHSVIFI